MDDSHAIVLIPGDDRPINTSLPIHLARLAGRAVSLPPRELLGRFGAPGQAEALGEWLLQQTSAEAALVSADMLAYGGFLFTSTADLPGIAARNNLIPLERLKAVVPQVPLLAFGVLPEVPQNDPLESRYQAFHEALMNYLAEGVLDYLVLTPGGPGEDGSLQAQQEVRVRQATDRGVRERLSLSLGARAAALVLLARVVIQAQNTPVRVAVHYAHPPDAERTPPGEEVPLAALVEGHLQAAGVLAAPSLEGADVALFVHTSGPDTPSPSSSPNGPKASSAPDFVREIGHCLSRGVAVAVADLAQLQRADPLLMEELRRQIPLSHLAAYAGGDTLRDNLGLALAQGCLAAVARAHAGAGEAIRRQRYLPAVFHRQFQKIAQLLQAEKTVVLLLDKDRQQLAPLPVARGFAPPELEALTFSPDSEFWSLALSLQTVRLEAEQPMDLPGSQEALAALKARNGLMVSLLSRQFREDLMLEQEVPMGLLCVLNKRHGTFTEEDETLLVLLARQTSAILRNMRRSEGELEQREPTHWIQTMQSQQQCLLMRLIEDWGYQTLIRPEIEKLLPAGVAAEDLGAAHSSVEVMMQERLGAWAQTFLKTHWCGRSLLLPHGAGQVRLPDEIPCRLSLPWPCTREVQVELSLNLQFAPEEELRR